jgi:predicted Zn-ribbon and HTH transcriptional regulator
MQDFNVRLSEFMPSTRDLQIVKKKCERRTNGSGKALPIDDEAEEFKDLTDLAALPVHDRIDLKLNVSSCELCGEEFRASVNKARDKGVHLLGHFREEILRDLPIQKPFKCPKCTFVGKDISGSIRLFSPSKNGFKRKCKYI